MRNDEEKYDIVPEIWEGHNIADYIDEDILQVSVHVIVSLPLIGQSARYCFLASDWSECT